MRFVEITSVALLIGVVLLGVVILFELAVGCGQISYSADRTYTTNECLFIPYTPSAGRW
jgi:hypothetical protein